MPDATTLSVEWLRRSSTGSSSRCVTFVAMVHTANLWEGDNGACGGWLCGPGFRTILVQREMRAASVVIVKICRQHTAQVTLIEGDDVIETFAADRADDALHIPHSAMAIGVL